jgi:hypothetical protein
MNHKILVARPVNQFHSGGFVEKTKLLSPHQSQPQRLSAAQQEAQHEARLIFLYEQLVELWKQYEEAILAGADATHREHLHNHIAEVRHHIEHIGPLPSINEFGHIDRRRDERRDYSNRRRGERRKGGHRLMLP